MVRVQSIFQPPAHWSVSTLCLGLMYSVGQAIKLPASTSPEWAGYSRHGSTFSFDITSWILTATHPGFKPRPCTCFCWVVTPRQTSLLRFKSFTSWPKLETKIWIKLFSQTKSSHGYRKHKLASNQKETSYKVTKMNSKKYCVFTIRVEIVLFRCLILVKHCILTMWMKHTLFHSRACLAQCIC